MRRQFFPALPNLFEGRNHSVLALDAGGCVAYEDGPMDEHAFRFILSWENIKTGDKVQDARLSRLVRAALNHSEQNDTPLPPPVRLVSNGGEVSYVDAVPLPPQFRDKLNGARVLLCIRAVEDEVNTQHELLRQQFGLTEAEALVAVRLSEGTSVKQTARQLGVSIWTVRTHLRSVFQKTGTHRQAELVSLLTHLAS